MIIMDGVKEHCGVFGVYSYSGANVTSFITQANMYQQNRGQESCGIAVQGNPTYKASGLMITSIEKHGAQIRKIMGSSGIGHIRYSTAGGSDRKDMHPIYIPSPVKFRIAHNGTISNTEEMRKLLRCGGIKVREAATDTELAGHLLSQFFAEKRDWISAFKHFDDMQNGSYSFVILTDEGEIVAARDSRGYKPLCYGYQEATDSYVVASESHALDMMGATTLGDIKPGQLSIFGKKGIELHQFAKANVKLAQCPFEITYFSRPESMVYGIQVAQARLNMGRELYQKFGLRSDIVVPVPESAIYAAIGYSRESGTELEFALNKDRYSRKSVLRGFIQPSDREKIANSISVVKEMVAGKSVIVIDDSIVRGTSSAVFIELLKKAGATYIALLSTFPPIRFPCFMGIDFATQKELIAYTAAANNDLEAVGAKVAKELGIDFVGYLDPMRLSRAIGIPQSSLCFACVDGNYKLNFPELVTNHAQLKAPEGVLIRS